jgi:hypothetical protein
MCLQPGAAVLKSDYYLSITGKNIQKELSFYLLVKE